MEFHHKEKSTMEKILIHPVTVTSTISGETITIVKMCSDPKCPERRLNITNKFALNN